MIFVHNRTSARNRISDDDRPAIATATGATAHKAKHYCRNPRCDDPTQLRFHPLADSGSSPILGVDPGITGGLAFLFPTGELEVSDIPVVAGEVDVDTLVRQVRAFSPALAVIERANAMPKQGVSSTFKYGVAYGALRTVVALCNIPYRLVTPGKWKAHFHLDADKEKSRALAIQLWPGCGYFALKKHHGRAEAALIARYGAETCPQANRGHVYERPR